MSAVTPAPGQPWQPRPMSRRDLERVAVIESQVYPFPWSRGNFSDSLAAGYDCWVFESGAELFAYAIVMWIPDEIHLLNLSVAASWQGKGYGGSILTWLMADAGRRGARSIVLEVRPSNLRARQLYERMGFTQIGMRRRYYPAADGVREDAVVMARSLLGEPRRG